MKKKLKSAVLLLAVVLILGAILFYPWSYAISSPGIAEELAGMVKIPGHSGEKPGKLYLTTVFFERANLFFFLLAQFFPPYELTSLKSEAIEDFGFYNRYMKIQMDESKLFARVAALRFLGYKIDFKPRGVRIYHFLPRTRARGILKVGDVIVKVDECPTPTISALTSYLEKLSPGEKVKLQVQRKGKELLLSVPLISYKGRTIIGFQPRMEYEVGELPVSINIDAGVISGASAGLMFALEIIRQLSDEPLTYWKVAGTGTISPEGEVGEVDGVEYKIITARKKSADIFLLPEKNIRDIARKDWKIKLIPVNTLSGAVEKLRALNRVKHL